MSFEDFECQAEAEFYAGLEGEAEAEIKEREQKQGLVERSHIIQVCGRCGKVDASKNDNHDCDFILRNRNY